MSTTTISGWITMLLIVAVAGTLPAQFGDSRGGNESVFRRNSTNRGADGSAADTQIPVLRLPKATQIFKPLNLMPAKPVLVAPDDAGTKSALDDFDRRWLELVRQVSAARRHQDHGALLQLSREIETLRRQRFEFLRPVAQRVAPTPTTPPSIPSLDGQNSGAQTRPSLPIPELPPKKRP